jgi:hypothetical protein
MSYTARLSLPPPKYILTILKNSPIFPFSEQRSKYLSSKLSLILRMFSPAHSFFAPTRGWEWESGLDGSTNALFPPCRDIGQGTALPLADVFTSWSDGTSIKIGYKKKLIVPNTAGSHNLTVYSLQVVLIPWSFWHQLCFLNQF